MQLSCPYISMGDWFQDWPRILKSTDVQVQYSALSIRGLHPRTQLGEDQLVLYLLKRNPRISDWCKSKSVLFKGQLYMLTEG